MNLTRSAVKFALLTIAIVSVFVGVRTVNTSLASIDDVVILDVKANTEPRRNGPINFDVTLRFNDKRDLQLEIYKIEVQLVLKKKGVPLGEGIVLYRDAAPGLTAAAGQPFKLKKPLNQSLPLISSQADTGEMVLTEFEGQIFEKKEKDKERAGSAGQQIALQTPRTIQLYNLSSLPAEELATNQQKPSSPPSTAPAVSFSPSPIATPSSPTPAATAASTTAASPRSAPPAAASPAASAASAEAAASAPSVASSPATQALVTQSQAVAIKSIDINAPSTQTGGKTQVVIRGLAAPNTQVEVTIQSKPQTFRVLAASEGNWVLRADLPLRPGDHQVLAKAITPDVLEAGPTVQTLQFTVPATEFVKLENQLIGGGMVIVGTIMSIVGLVL